MKRIALIILTACILVSATSCSVVGTGSITDSKLTAEEVYDELVYLLETYGESHWFYDFVFPKDGVMGQGYGEYQGEIYYNAEDDVVCLHGYVDLDPKLSSLHLGYNDITLWLYIDAVNIEQQKFDWEVRHSDSSLGIANISGVLDGTTFMSRTNSLTSTDSNVVVQRAGQMEQYAASLLKSAMEVALIPLIEKSEKITLEDIGFTRYQ